MSDPIDPTTEPLVYTSAPVDGWVAVPAANLEKADGYVSFVEDEGASAWHFTIANVSGTSDQLVVCSKLCEAIAQFAKARSGMHVSLIHFNEPIAERLSLPPRYVIPT